MLTTITILAKMTANVFSHLIPKTVLRRHILVFLPFFQMRNLNLEKVGNFYPYHTISKG